MQPTAMDTARGRFASIDGLRGIAALLVVLQHAMEQVIYAPQAAPALNIWLRRLFLDDINIGRVGVTAFFLISGFVIPFSFKGAAPVRSFLLSRFFRLYPAYWLSMILALAILPFVDNTVFSPSQIAADATMLQMVIGQPNMLGTYWTLPLELFFYALCVLLFLRGKLSSPLWLAGASAVSILVALGAALVKYTAGYNLPVGGIFLIALMPVGALARQSLIDRNPQAELLLPKLLIAIACLTSTLFYLGYARAPQESWLAFVASSYLGAALFFFCALRRKFTGNIAVYLGRISYSIYLVHPIILPVAQHMLAGSAWTTLAVALPALTVMLTIIVASAVYYLIEKPAIMFGHRLAARRRATGMNWG